jgi:hypothetical protein
MGCGVYNIGELMKDPRFEPYLIESDIISRAIKLDHVTISSLIFSNEILRKEYTRHRKKYNAMAMASIWLRHLPFAICHLPGNA